MIVGTREVELEYSSSLLDFTSPLLERGLLHTHIYKQHFLKTSLLDPIYTVEVFRKFKNLYACAALEMVSLFGMT